MALELIYNFVWVIKPLVLRVSEGTSPRDAGGSILAKLMHQDDIEAYLYTYA